jgi:hypothetical protein
MNAKQLERVTKITAEQAVEWEIESLRDAIGNCIELNDTFLARNCSDTVKSQLLRVPEDDREYLLADCITHAWANGSPASRHDGIWLELSEIELQIDSIDDLEDPDDWTINGDLAYYYVGYGVSFDVNTDQLERDVNDFLSDS